ncbi:MAG: AMP-binding protein, partial [Rhizobiales bacterium]|nr:AMP-binding protein [Hyphomicrobiales bacterium]
MRLEGHLAPRQANYQPLTPVAFLERAVEAFPERLAVVWDQERWTYREFASMAARFGERLKRQGIAPGDVVSMISHNRPELLAAHYAVPAIGAVLNAINTRLDPGTVGYILKHAQSRLLIADPGSLEVAREAAVSVRVPLWSLGPDGGDGAGEMLDLVNKGGESDRFTVEAVCDEWQPLCLNYTSGTTGRPKGVVYHHRGAYLNALGNVLALGLDRASVYLWTLPMFHCSGWSHSWAVTAAGAVHVCLEKPDPAQIFAVLERDQVTHFACAPVILYMLLNDPKRQDYAPMRRITVGTGGAAPTSALIEQLDALGIDIVHLYGLTESYGPVTLCEVPAQMADADPGTKALFLARQGVSHMTANRVRIVDQQGAEVAADGVQLGEILLQGNTLMAGYYKDEAASEAAFADGWFRTGDLAVRHPDGAIEIRDRAKDIVISGGENISSLEIESVLHQHPAV